MAGYIIDSHIFLWAIQEPSELRAAERKIIADSASDIAVSAASLWELSIKIAIGRLTFAGSQRPLPPNHFSGCAAQMGFIILPIYAPETEQVRQLPHVHHDPFDRLIIAQALISGRTLITRDRVFARYPGLQLFSG